ncbi:hypothetical protein [Thiosulfatihalobacter marinus]|uniref:hypothetical protein n=1 Tax=Thiosulfatihalobacter marinus TaxID=2792481 RepID=UPI0018D5F2A7|nr:hypothetical protein [Thiosulfatihalobacter marinus]
MHPDLKARRRMVMHTSRAYVAADLSLRRALEDARTLVPDVIDHSIWRIGHPGSRIRRLYDERHRALERMQVACLKFDLARRRLLARQRSRRVLAIAYMP